jgi:hypothetical protein
MTEIGRFGLQAWDLEIKGDGGPVKANSQFSAQNHVKKPKGRSFPPCSPSVFHDFRKR